MNSLLEFLMRNKIVVLIIGVVLVFALKTKDPEPVKQALVKEDKAAPIPIAARKTVVRKSKKPDYSHISFAPVNYNENGKLSESISVTYKDITQLAVKPNCVRCFGHASFRPEGYVDNMQIEVKQKEPFEGIYYRTLGRFDVIGMKKKMSGNHKVIIYLHSVDGELGVEAYYFEDKERVYLELEQVG